MTMQFTYTDKPTPEQAIAQGIKQFVSPLVADQIVMKEAINTIAMYVAEEIEAMQAEAATEPPSDYTTTVNGWDLTVSGPLGKPAYYIGAARNAAGSLYKVTRETFEEALDALTKWAEQRPVSQGYGEPQVGDIVEIVRSTYKMWLGYRAKVTAVFDRNLALSPIGPRPHGSLHTSDFYWNKKHVKVVHRP